MKLLLLILTIVSSLHANEAPETRLLRILEDDPYRKFEGQIYNVSPIAKSAIPKALGYVGVIPLEDSWYFIRGEVLQIPGGGMLCTVKANPYDKTDYDTRTIFLKNHPNERTKIDGDGFCVLARYAGRFEYSSALGGAKRTVDSYDYGEIPNSKELRPLIERKEREAAERMKKLHELVNTRSEDQAKKKAEKSVETERKAIDFQKQRAEDGSAQAQYDLAVRYRDGKGVEQDKAKAKQWFEKSAAQGHNQAKSELGKIK